MFRNILTRTMSMLAEGSRAPDFTALDHTGKKVSLSDFHGNRFLLWFYPKADTPGCTAEACGLRDRRPDYDSAGVRIVGVSFDDVDSNKAFVDKYNLPFQLLCDTDRKIGLAYGAADSPSASHAKRISYLISGEGTIEKGWEKVVAKDHPQEVLAFIQQKSKASL